MKKGKRFYNTGKEWESNSVVANSRDTFELETNPLSPTMKMAMKHGWNLWISPTGGAGAHGRYSHAIAKRGMFRYRRAVTRKELLGTCNKRLFRIVTETV